MVKIIPNLSLLPLLIRVKVLGDIFSSDTKAAVVI